MKEVPIIHVCASDATISYTKLSIANGCRLGIAMYGLMENKHIEQIAKYLDTIPYEVICSISKRVPRIYVE